MNKENLDEELALRKEGRDLLPMPNMTLHYETRLCPNLFETLNHFNHWLEKFMSNHKYLEQQMQDFVIYIAYCYPLATTRQLFAISRAMVWAFVFDDMVMEKFKTYDEAMTYVNKNMEIWDSQDLKRAHDFCIYSEIFMRAYQSISYQLSPAQKSRFRQQLLNYLEGSAEENWIRNGPISSEEFIRIRRKANGSGFFLIFIEMVLGIDMSPYMKDDIFIQNEHAIQNTVAWINDLYSYNRERKYECVANLVIQFHINDKISPSAAMDKAFRLFYKWVNILDVTNKQMLEAYEGDKGVIKYVKGLEDWLEGNRQWTLYCRRYSIYNDFLDYHL